MIKLFCPCIEEISRDEVYVVYGESWIFYPELPEHFKSRSGYQIKTIDLDKSCIIDAPEILKHPSIELASDTLDELAASLGISRLHTEELIAGTSEIFSIIDTEDIGLAYWRVQEYAAKAAFFLGFRGVRMKMLEDDGDIYIVYMQGHEDELKIYSTT